MLNAYAAMVTRCVSRWSATARASTCCVNRCQATRNASTSWPCDFRTWPSSLCKNTIDRLRVERGIEVKLIPDAEVIDSGCQPCRQTTKEGWSYIRVSHKSHA